MFTRGRDHNNLSFVSIFCRVGSNYEPEGLYGASHFIEHMLFKGTTNIPNAKDIAKIFDSIGAYFNAYTDKNKTCYVVKGSSDYLEKIITTLSDMLTNSLFSEEFERKSSCEEINRAKDNAANFVNEEIYKSYSKAHLSALPCSDIDILDYKRDAALHYFKYFYHPEKAVVSICSNVDFDTVKKLVEKSYLITNQFSEFVPPAINTEFIDTDSVYVEDRVQHSEPLSLDVFNAR